jgi:hypothetical protein
MSGTVAASTVSLDRFASIDLAELIELAALQTRIDRKYIVPVEAITPLVESLDPATRVLQIAGARTSAYESVYFDTPTLDSYWQAARGRRRRFKIRTRSYLDSGDCYLEVKTQGARSATVKDRLPYELSDRSMLTTAGLAYVDAVLADAGIGGVRSGALQPQLVTSYDRSTLFVPSSASRATIDTALSWRLGERAQARPGIVIVETKSGSRASSVDRALWAHGHRPMRISKYATGLAAMRPELASNRWTPVLRRHFDHAA